MPPIQLTYNLMTRSLRVSHASVAKRDPQLARGVERVLAASSAVRAGFPARRAALRRRAALPLALGDHRDAERGSRSTLPLLETARAEPARERRRARRARRGRDRRAPGSS